MKRILVPTDYSECATYAVDVAKQIAEQSGAELYIIHLEETIPEVAHVMHHSVEVENPHHLGHARYQLQSLVEVLEKEGIKAKGVFVPNDGKEAIEDYIKPYEIDFIVMGSHGAKGIREALIGSNTQRLIKHAMVPVLVIKHPDKKFNPKRILFASTFREDISKSLRKAVEFARLWNAEIDLVFLNMLNHLIEEHEAKRIMARQIAPIPDIRYTLNISETNDEEWGISKFARAINADVISVVCDTHTGFSRLFNSSVAEKLINHESLPVLVMAH
jgi:nucleotide-binding universal stress UspA family protein